MKLSEEIRDAIDGATETRGRDSQLTEWIERLESMEATASTQAVETERTFEAMLKAQLRCAELHAELAALSNALRQITKIAPLGVPTYPECYRQIQAIASAALADKQESG